MSHCTDRPCFVSPIVRCWSWGGSHLWTRGNTPLGTCMSDVLLLTQRRPPALPALLPPSASLCFLNVSRAAEGSRSPHVTLNFTLPSLRGFCPLTFNTVTTEPSPSSRKRRWGHRGLPPPGNVSRSFCTYSYVRTHTQN